MFNQIQKVIECAKYGNSLLTNNLIFTITYEIMAQARIFKDFFENRDFQIKLTIWCNFNTAFYLSTKNRSKNQEPKLESAQVK